jgi:hypothetical protein
MNLPTANDHPFQVLFESLGRLPASHADSVNRQAYEILSDILTVPVQRPGRCILLRAPRAGHGKTHLLSRIQHQLGSTHEFIPLRPAFGCRIDALSVIDDALRRLLRPLPASGGLCVLDLVTRRLFASALQPLVGSGEVPCQDREGALSALRSRPIETFDFHHPNAVTAHWARENFEVLGQRLSMELAQRCDLPIREVSFWVHALFRFAVTPVENPGRVATLSESAHSGDPANGVAMERLEALLGLLTLLTRVVLVADDLEGFSTDDTAALRLAAFLGSLRQSVERLDVILSLNMDIWQSAFLPRLSGGLTDRLSEVVIELTPLTKAEMIALLDSRVPGLGDRVLERIDLNEAGTHARGLIRAAGIAWLRATAMDAATVPALHPVAEPAAVAPVAAPEIVAVAPDVPASDQVMAGQLEQDMPAAEPPVSWPAPEFAPAPAAEVVAPPMPESEPVETFVPSQWQPAAPVFTPPQEPEAEVAPPAVDSPFQAAPQVFTAEPVDTSPPRVDSPFQSAPSAVAAALEAAASASWDAAPAPSDSPFHAVAPVFEAPAQIFPPSPEPVFVPSGQPVATPAPPPAADTDRVDELLQQFRERYGRGSL